MAFWNSKKSKNTARLSNNRHRPMTFSEVMEDPEAKRQFRREIEKALASNGDDAEKRLESMTPDEITDKVVREIRKNHLPVPVTRNMVKLQVLWFLDKWDETKDPETETED